MLTLVRFQFSEENGHEAIVGVLEDVRGSMNASICPV